MFRFLNFLFLVQFYLPHHQYRFISYINLTVAKTYSFPNKPVRTTSTTNVCSRRSIIIRKQKLLHLPNNKGLPPQIVIAPTQRVVIAYSGRVLVLFPNVILVSYSIFKERCNVNIIQGLRAKVK